MAGAFQQSRTAMSTDVAQRADAAAPLAKHDHAVRPELEGEVVAWLGELTHVTGDLPTRLEDALDLEARELGVVVDPGRERARRPAWCGGGHAGGGRVHGGFSRDGYTII